jgi:hypothetical protein
MSRRRLIVQMGMGVGNSPGEAAARALADAQGRAQVHVDVPFTTRLTLGLPEPQEIAPNDLAAALGTADLELHVVAGGMIVPQPGGAPLVVVSAAIEMFPHAVPDEA